MADPIIFEDLPGTPDVDASAHGFGRLRGKGLANSKTLAQLGAIGAGALRGRANNGGDFVEITPPASGQGFLHGRQTLGYSPGSYPFATAENQRLRGVGLASYSPNVGVGRLRGVGRATGFSADDVVTPPDYWADAITLYDTVNLTGTLRAIDGLLLRSAVRLRGTQKMKAATFEALHDALSLDDRFSLVLMLMLKSAVAVGDTLTFDYTALMRLHDNLVLSGAVSTAAEAHMLMVEAVAFGATMEAALLLNLTDQVAMSDLIRDSFTAAMQLVDHLLLADTATGTGTIAMSLRDTVALSDEVLTAADVVALLEDAVGLTLQFTLDDGHYVAWTMNADNKASSKYEQWPFNSYMKVGGRYYGASDTGLYRLGGDTDDTADIKAKIRLGMNALGSRLAKHVPDVYLGYSASGDMLLKAVVANSTTGQREAHVYRLYANDSADSVRDGRRKIGRGLNAVYWDWVMENVDGAAFDLDVIEFMPLMTQRRLRGNAGGKK